VGTPSISLRPAGQTGWIISGTEDLTWFIGPALVSYAALALMVAGFPLTPLYLVWLLGIDGPHVLATVTRTYFDNNARRRLGPLLWVAVPAMLAGPLMVAAGGELLFYTLAITWLHFHIAKQHFGFVMLYRHKAGDRDRTDYLLDRWFLLTSLMLPFARFLVKSSFVYLPTLPAVRLLDALLLTAYCGMAAVYVLRQFHIWRAGRPLNGPKLMLCAAIIPLQWLAFGYAGTTVTDGMIRAGIVLGLFHSFQYHRLMWFHNRNHYSEPQFATSAGLAATLARRFAYYFGAAVLLNLGLNVLPSYYVPSPLVKAALWGIPFTHYILDSKIWRVRGNKELAAALRLSG
jgi:hypothetical protein